MKKLDLFDVVKWMDWAGIESLEWSFHDLRYEEDAELFFGTTDKFTLPPGKYIVTYVELNDKELQPTFMSDLTLGGTIRFYFVG